MRRGVAITLLWIAAIAPPAPAPCAAADRWLDRIGGTGALPWGHRSDRGDAGVLSAIEPDRRLERTNQSALESFAEGDLDDATKQFRRILLRSWATDDPYWSGKTAYHLAACLVAREMPYQALDYLVDARAEYRRAGCSAADAWLLESRILLSMDDLPSAQIALHQAGRQPAACQCDLPLCRCAGGVNARADAAGVDCECLQCNRLSVPAACANESSSCLENLPCVGTKIRVNRQNEACRSGHAARLRLAAARLAIATGDLPAACAKLRCAVDQIDDICDPSLSADIQDVAALVQLSLGNDDQAVKHLDRQVQWLRFAKQYREIPNILIRAADIDARQNRLSAAAARYNRAARIYFVRGDLDRSWELIQHASEWVRATPCQTIAVRLAITADEVARALRQKRDQRRGTSWAMVHDEPESKPNDPIDHPVDPAPDGITAVPDTDLGQLLLRSPIQSVGQSDIDDR